MPIKRVKLPVPDSEWIVFYEMELILRKTYGSYIERL